MEAKRIDKSRRWQDRGSAGKVRRVALFPPILIGCCSAAIFIWLSAALGDRVMRLLRVPRGTLSRLERGTAGAAIGAGCLQLLPYALGMSGNLSKLSVRIGCGAVAALLLPDLARVARRALQAAAEFIRRRHDAATLAWAGLFAIYILCLLVRAVVVGNMGDDDGYHLAAPRRWLASGALGYLPTLTHTNGTMGLEMLNLLALGVAGPVAAKTIHFSAGLLCLSGLFCCARRLGGNGAALLMVALALLPNPLNELPTLIAQAYNDLGVVWMMVSGLIFWLASRDSKEPRLRACVALCAGFAASFKFTALTLCAAFPLLFLIEEDAATRWSKGLRRAFVYGLIALLPVLPWLVRNGLLTGNPVYPMLSSIIPTRDWSPELARVFSQFFRYYNWGKAYAHQWSETRRAVMLACTSAVILGACALAIWRTKHGELRSLLILGTVLLATALGVTGLYFRFWLPSMLCLCLAATAVLGRQRFVPAASCAILLLGLLLRIRAEVLSPVGVGVAGDLRIALGLQSLGEAYKHEPVWETWQYINSHTPPDSHILIGAFYTTFGASSGGAFWLDRAAYVTDSQLQGYIHLESWDSFLESVKKARIDYVLVSDVQFTADRLGFSFPASMNEYPYCKRLAVEHGELLASYEHLQLYRLRPFDL
jgi:hypothetical protein